MLIAADRYGFQQRQAIPAATGEAPGQAVRRSGGQAARRCRGVGSAKAHRIRSARIVGLVCEPQIKSPAGRGGRRGWRSWAWGGAFTPGIAPGEGGSRQALHLSRSIRPLQAWMVREDNG